MVTTWSGVGEEIIWGLGVDELRKENKMVDERSVVSLTKDLDAVAK